jgi:hypothetical protein
MRSRTRTQPDPSIERDRLLTRISARKAELDRLIEKGRMIGLEIADEVQPIAAEHRAVSDEIRRLFAELAAPGRLPKRAKKQVAAAYESLEEAGILFDGESEPSEPPIDRLEGGYSAQRPDDGTANRGIRDVYRRLAGALHPDRVLEEDEKARRTEAMKRVTVAYGEGDLASLVEIEKRLGAAAETPSASGGVEALSRTNAELRRQLAALEGKVGEIKGSLTGTSVKAMRQMAEQARAELADLQAVRDFVRSFRDGKIDLARFLLGPNAPEDADDDDDDDDDEDADEEMLHQVLVAIANLAAAAGETRPAKPRRRRSKRKRSVPGSYDLPF